MSVQKHSVVGRRYHRPVNWLLDDISEDARYRLGAIHYELIFSIYRRLF